MFQDNGEKIIKYLYANINRSKYYGFQFNAYTRLSPFWNISAVLDINYFEDQFFVIDSNENNLLSFKKWIYSSEISNYFSFLKDKSLTADIAFFYFSKYVDGSSAYSAVSSLDINIKKTFWNNR